MLKLQFKDQRKPAIWLVETRYALGKDPQNAIVLADDGVSPFHAEIRVEGEQVFISDTGSSNGTFVNDKRIQRRTELRPSDVIRLHTVEFLLIDPKQAAAQAPDGATAISPALGSMPVANAGARQGSGWSLKAKTGSIVGQSFVVPSVGKLVIGRAANCDVQLPANHVSRQHAEVQVSSGKLIVRDLNSSNGTFVNRKRITEAELKPGDEVRFDTFNFDVVGQAATGTAAVADDGAGKTQFRQAITPEAAAAARPKPTAPAKPHSLTSTTRLAPVVDDGKPAVAAASQGSGSKMLVVIAAVVIIGGAVAYFALM